MRRIVTLREQHEMLAPWRTAMPEVYRGLGLRGKDLPSDLRERMDNALDGGEDEALHKDLLHHLNRDGQGLGTWWSRDQDTASGYVQDGFGPRDHDYEVSLKGDWDGSNSLHEQADPDNPDTNVEIQDGTEIQMGDIGVRRPGGDWSHVRGRGGWYT